MESKYKMFAFHYPVSAHAFLEPKEGCRLTMWMKFGLHEKLSPMIVLAMVHAMAMVAEVEVEVEMAEVIPVVPVELDWICRGQ